MPSELRWAAATLSLPMEPGVIPVVLPAPCLHATSFPHVPVMKTRLSPHKESELVYSGVNMSSHGLETQV